MGMLQNSKSGQASLKRGGFGSVTLWERWALAGLCAHGTHTAHTQPERSAMGASLPLPALLPRTHRRGPCCEMLLSLPR